MSQVESSVPDTDLNDTGAKFSLDGHGDQNVAARNTTQYKTQFSNPEYYGAGKGLSDLYHAESIRVGTMPDQLQLRPSQAQTQGRPHSREGFQIAIICALPLECDAVSLLFDQFWDEDESYGRAHGDTNTYIFGRMGRRNVVLALLPNGGTVSTATAAKKFQLSYPNLQLAFRVGICSGVPRNEGDEVHLGDVVISKSVVQYKLGIHHFQTPMIIDIVNDSLREPNKSTRSLVAYFETEFTRGLLQQRAFSYLKDLQNAAVTKRRRQNYQYPGIHNDKLFIAAYQHKYRGQQPCNFCDNQADSFCEQAAKASCAELMSRL